MDTEAQEKSEKSSEEDYPFHHFIKRMILAGIGAFSLSQEEWDKFIDKMVEKGELTHKDHEMRMTEMRERRTRFFQNRKGFAHDRVARALEEFNVPTKTDIDLMNAKISELEKKLDDMKKEPE